MFSRNLFCQNMSQLQVISKDGHMTSAEVQRHLEARQQRFLDQAVASIPAEMFSNDPSLDIDRFVSSFYLC